VSSGVSLPAVTRTLPSGSSGDWLPSLTGHYTDRTFSTSVAARKCLVVRILREITVPGELQFIRQLQARFPAVFPVTTGIGDDGAVLDCSSESRFVAVTDMLLDGAHFDASKTPATLIGRKAVAVNLSDLAAMGCRPTAAFVSVAIDARRDPERQQEFLQQVYDGIEELAERHQFTVAGGDTNAWQAPFAINVCLLGSPFHDEPVLRSGASPGDHLLITGPLGGSLHSGRHLTFEPRLDLAKWLMEHCRPGAMIDISDGLSLDASRLAERSSVRAVIRAGDIPIHGDVADETDRNARLNAALNDGEDFELLFAVTAEQADWLTRGEHSAPGHFTRIGELTEGSGCQLIGDDGASADLTAQGYQHQF